MNFSRAAVLRFAGLAVGAVVLVACGGADSAGSSGAAPESASQTMPSDCTPTGSTTASRQTYAEVPGVSPAYLQMDVAVPTVPAGCPRPPVVLYAHGGNFDNGSRTTVEQQTAQTALFTSKGWALATMNYQLIGPANAGALTSSFPVQPGNVASAVAWLGQNADELGVDGGRVALMGPTAGGFLSAQVGADDELLLAAGATPEAVRCVITMTVEGYDLASLTQGDSPSAARWRTAFPDPGQWREASPITHVLTTPTPRQWLLVTIDNRQWRAAAQEFAQNVRAGSGLAETLFYDPAAIPRPADVVGQPGESIVTPAVVATLQSCLNG